MAILGLLLMNRVILKLFNNKSDKLIICAAATPYFEFYFILLHFFQKINKFSISLNLRYSNYGNKIKIKK